MAAIDIGRLISPLLLRQEPMLLSVHEVPCPMACRSRADSDWLDATPTEDEVQDGKNDDDQDDQTDKPKPKSRNHSPLLIVSRGICPLEAHALIAAVFW
jgi:hypothetical protein